MKSIINCLILLFVVVATLPSCVSSKKFDALMLEKDELSKSLTDTRNKVEALSNEKDELQAMQSKLEDEKTSLSGKISKLQDDLSATKEDVNEVKKQVAEKEEALQKLKRRVSAAFTTYAESGLTVDDKDGKLYLSVPNKIMYKSGSTRINKDGRDVIKVLASKLKSNANLKLMVEGHTDRDPIQSVTYLNNWELSVARATRVVKNLIKEGVNPSQLVTMGQGDTMPSTADDTPESKAVNRRTEFVLIPDMMSLYTIMKDG